MSSILEEKLREASCLGDTEAVLALLSQNINVNSSNIVNGWTALHWACKRNHEDIVRILLENGADKTLQTVKGETPASVCTSQNILDLLGVPYKPVNNHMDEELGMKFTPNYIKNPPINGQVDIGRLRSKHTDFSNMQTTTLPAAQNDDLVLKVKVQGSSDPDFIEVEIPRWKLTYNTLMKICCEELEILECQVERIRKLPNTRLRKDSDVKRLVDGQALEIVLKPPTGEKTTNCYQSIST
ncbi:ankyrin repeat domain-containing protein 40 isoform X4 [Aethina tumida]|nr:ankyrin repeat domain-containing protein 40 isoform X3 [Aethina tumida]XP_049817477.1 ankyrin repeat domain-containing protein 40 isoform X4 [Aethina tumida]